jgi:PHD/YefM family antitoxin component YafN of YafNO toxin-antitoxin module
VKTLELSHATAPLLQYAKENSKEPLVLTRKGRPVAALIQIEDVDWETVSLCGNPQFIAMLEDARAQHRAGLGIPIEELRKEFGLPCRPHTSGRAIAPGERPRLRRRKR